MLHLEIYTNGASSASLTTRVGELRRRSGVTDPAPYLNVWKIVGSNIYATGSPFKVFKRENNRAWSNISDSIPISRGDIEEKAVVMVRVFFRT